MRGMWLVKGVLDLATALRTIVFVVFLLGERVGSEAQSRVNYVVLEGQPAATFVGDLLRDGNLTDEPQPTFTIRRRHRPTPLPFSVDRRSGTVRTAAVLDREELCPLEPDWSEGGDQQSGSECLVSFEVIVESGTSSRTIRVDVEVLDLNDNAPSFPDSEV